MKFNILEQQYSALSLGIFGFIVILAAYYLGSRTGKGKAISADSESLQKEIKQQPLTYDLSNYESMADKLEDAMYGFTNDKDAVFAVFSKLRNKSDVLQLIVSFGERRIIWTFGNANLNRWINNRFGSDDIAHINSILSRNNIAYEF